MSLSTLACLALQAGNSTVASEFVKNGTAVAAIIIAVVSLVISVRERQIEKRASTARALQGDKESVAAVAFRLHRDPTAVHPAVVEDVIAALCFAWVMESSDRARAVIIAALKALRKHHLTEIRRAVEDISILFRDYSAIPGTNISRGNAYLETLRKGLAL